MPCPVCPECNQEAPHGANFCQECGSALVIPGVTPTPESEEFHRKWGEAATKPDYNKQEWLDRQRGLQARGVPA